MHRARLLVFKAHPDIAHASQKRILITSFLLGLYDRQLASSLAVVKIQTSADAKRLAAEGEAVRRDQRSWRSTNNFLPQKPSAQDPGSHEQRVRGAPRRTRRGAQGSFWNAQPVSNKFQFKLEPPRTAQSDKRYKMIRLRAVWPLQVGLP